MEQMILERTIEVDGDRMTISEFLEANHYNRENEDGLSETQLQELLSLESGAKMFIHLSEIISL